MPGLLGPVGGLEKLRCVSRLTSSPVRDTVLDVTPAIGGRAEYAQISAGRPSREWEAGLSSAHPEDMRVLARMERRVRRQRETLVYYSEDAQVENLLDPDAALMELHDPILNPEAHLRGQAWKDLLPGGARVLPDDHLPGIRFDSSGACDGGKWAHLSTIPVPHNVQVTASIYVTSHVGAQARFWVDELDMDNRTIQPVHKAAAPAGAVLTRLSHTFITTPQTVALTFGVSWASAVVAPQLTFTPGPVGWVDGQGCVSAIPMAPATKDVQAAFLAPNDRGRRSAYSWRIREVQGDGD